MRPRLAKGLLGGPAVLWWPVLCCALLLVGCAFGGGAAQGGGNDASASEASRPHTVLVEGFRDTDLGCGWEPVGQMELRYARCYTVDYYEGGYALVCVADGERYLVVPEGGAVPEGLARDVVVVEQPLSDVYLAASDSLCLFDALDALDLVTVSGIERDGWYLPAAREAMDTGAMMYGGNYRSPDYELLVDRGVRLALESTMINHTPAVREKLLSLGIPVLTELSSYEPEPLGRCEWVRLYGLLTGRDEAARRVFDEQEGLVTSMEAEPTGKTVAFFYLNANGAAVVRRPGDYVTKMIEQAGGRSAFEGLEEARAGSSSLTMEMERFYTLARDADVVVYNATIDDTVRDLDDLLGKNDLLADFSAVRSGEVYVCAHDMYQQMVDTGAIIRDFNRVLTGDAGDAAYLRRLT